MNQLDRFIWRSTITANTKIRLYVAYIQPVLLYGAETWSMTQTIQRKVDAFDLRCLRRILRISYRDHISSDEVRRRTGCTAVSELIRARRLRLFGHLARAGPSADCARALRVTGFQDTGDVLAADLD